MAHDATPWLDPEQQRWWRAYIVGTTSLLDRLDRDLREHHQLSLPEYEMLVRLSEAPGRRLRMAVLADSVSHSRSRVTHTISRLERAGLVERSTCSEDGRGVQAGMTERGFGVLEQAAPTHVAGVRRYLVDIARDDLAVLGRIFASVNDSLAERVSPG